MKKIIITASLLLSINAFASNAVVLDYYLISSFTTSKTESGKLEYYCVQGGKTYKLSIEEYHVLYNNKGMIEKR